MRDIEVCRFGTVQDDVKKRRVPLYLQESALSGGHIINNRPISMALMSAATNLFVMPGKIAGYRIIAVISATALLSGRVVSATSPVADRMFLESRILEETIERVYHSAIFGQPPGIGLSLQIVARLQRGSDPYFYAFLRHQV